MEADELIKEGSETGMVKDFSCIKEAMIECIDKTCDHKLILYFDDCLLQPIFDELGSDVVERIKDKLRIESYYILKTSNFGDICIVGFVPTAENLARHWYKLLKKKLIGFRLKRVIVWETPTSKATYEET